MLSGTPEIPIGAFFESTLKNAEQSEEIPAGKSWQGSCQQRVTGRARGSESRREQEGVNLCWTQIPSEGDSMSLNEVVISKTSILLTLAPQGFSCFDS